MGLKTDGHVHSSQPLYGAGAQLGIRGFYSLYPEKCPRLFYGDTLINTCYFMGAKPISLCKAAVAEVGVWILPVLLLQSTPCLSLTDRPAWPLSPSRKAPSPLLSTLLLLSPTACADLPRLEHTAFWWCTGSTRPVHALVSTPPESLQMCYTACSQRPRAGIRDLSSKIGLCCYSRW